MRALLLSLIGASTLFAASAPVNQVPSAADEFALNRQFSPAQAQKRSLGTKLRQAHNIAVGTWDYSVSGYDSNGDKSVGISLPSGAIIKKAYFDVVTQPTPSGVSIAIKAQSAGDLKTTTAASSWTGRVDGALDGAVANFIKLTADRVVYATLSGSTATAGKIKVFVEYILSE